MKTLYDSYTQIDKKLLDSIEVGDLVKINEWKKPLRVKGVSENYFVMETKQFKDTIYSVCEKKPWGGIMHNAMRGGMFHCGTDNWVFSWHDGYDFTDSAAIAVYLKSFEDGETELSHRNAVPIHTLFIKKQNFSMRKATGCDEGNAAQPVLQSAT